MHGVLFIIMGVVSAIFCAVMVVGIGLDMFKSRRG